MYVTLVEGLWSWWCEGPKPHFPPSRGLVQYLLIISLSDLQLWVMLKQWVQRRHLASLTSPLTQQYKHRQQQQSRLSWVLFAKGAELYWSPCNRHGLVTLWPSPCAQVFSLLIPNVLWHDLAGSGGWRLAHVNTQCWQSSSVSKADPLYSEQPDEWKKTTSNASVTKKCYSISSNIKYVPKWCYKSGPCWSLLRATNSVSVQPHSTL